MELVRRLLTWFGRNARDLPWRTSGRAGARDPYQTLVSELMLQQTQVARVLEKYQPFLTRFPTVRALAAAAQEEVLAAWSGLGYYRRARLLHAAAKAVVADFGGTFPPDAAALRTLPGVGRYTAGAISSLAFGAHEPLVDGNVTRVLLRISARPGRLAEKETEAWAWNRATELLDSVPAGQAGMWNEGLMELGATVCLPAAPRCVSCPVSELCAAYAGGTVDEIPAPKVAAKRTVLHWGCLVLTDAQGRVYLERRPDSGLFAGLEQVPLVEGTRRVGRADMLALAEALGAGPLTRAGSAEFTLTHRTLLVTIWKAEMNGMQGSGRWVATEDLAEAALANVQRSILARCGIGP